MSHPIQYHAPLFGFLARDGRFRVNVIYMTDRGARPFYEPFSRTTVKFDNPILLGYDHVFLRSGEPKNGWQRKTEFLSLRLSEEIRKGSPQAVYFHGYANPSFWWAIFRCRKSGVKVFLRGENEDVLPRPFWRNWLRETFLRVLLPNIDAFLTIGIRNREFFLKRGVPEGRLFYVPYAVDNAYFREGFSPGELEQMRRRVILKYGLPEDTRLFIYAHKFRHTMRPLDAVRAFCHLPERSLLRAALLMCGDGELRVSLEELARQRGKGRVIFAGYLKQSELREHLLASDVMINPAEEPWGCSINEGLASGLAIVSSDKVVGWPDMVIPEVNGYAYPCGDIGELSKHLHRLCFMAPDQLARMKEESLRLSRKLSFATCADGLAAAMESVCR